MKRKMIAVFAVIMALKCGAGAFALNSSEKDYLSSGVSVYSKDYYDKYKDKYYYDRYYDRYYDWYYSGRYYDDKYYDKYYDDEYYRLYGNDIFDERCYRKYDEDSKTYYRFEDFYYKDGVKRYVEIRYYYKNSDKYYDIYEYYYDGSQKKYNVNVLDKRLSKNELAYYLEYYLDNRENNYKYYYDRYYDKYNGRYYDRYYDDRYYYYYDRHDDRYYRRYRYYDDFARYSTRGDFIDKVGDIASLNRHYLRDDDVYKKYPWAYGRDNYYYSEYNDKLMKSKYANIAKMLPSDFPDKNGNYPKKEDYKDKKKELTEALSDQIVFEKSYINTVYFETGTVKSLLDKFFYEQTKNLNTDRDRLNAFLYYFGFTEGFESEFGYKDAAKEFLIDFGERYYLLLKYYDEGSLTATEINNMKGYHTSTDSSSTGITVSDYFAQKNKKISEELK